MQASLLVIRDTSDLCTGNRQAGWLPAGRKLHRGEGTVNLLVVQASQAFHVKPLYLLAIAFNQGNRKQFG